MSVVDWKKEVIADVERPPGIPIPKTPLCGGRESEFPQRGSAEAVEVDADFNTVADAENGARSKGGGDLVEMDRTVKLAVDFAFVEDVGAGNVEDRLLG